MLTKSYLDKHGLEGATSKRTKINIFDDSCNRVRSENRLSLGRMGLSAHNFGIDHNSNSERKSVESCSKQNNKDHSNIYLIEGEEMSSFNPGL